MTCNDEHLILYVENALDMERRQDVQTHLAQCSQCRKKAQDLTQTIKILKSAASCPCDEDLIAFTQSKSPDAFIYEHVQICPICKEIVAALTEAQQSFDEEKIESKKSPLAFMKRKAFYSALATAAVIALVIGLFNPTMMSVMGPKNSAQMKESVVITSTERKSSIQIKEPAEQERENKRQTKTASFDESVERKPQEKQAIRTQMKQQTQERKASQKSDSQKKEIQKEVVLKSSPRGEKETFGSVVGSNMPTADSVPTEKNLTQHDISSPPPSGSPAGQQQPVAPPVTEYKMQEQTKHNTPLLDTKTPPINKSKAEAGFDGTKSTQNTPAQTVGADKNVRPVAAPPKDGATEQNSSEQNWQNITKGAPVHTRMKSKDKTANMSSMSLSQSHDEDRGGETAQVKALTMEELRKKIKEICDPLFGAENYETHISIEPGGTYKINIKSNASDEIKNKAKQNLQNNIKNPTVSVYFYK